MRRPGQTGPRPSGPAGSGLARTWSALAGFLPMTPRESAVKALLEAHHQRLVDLDPLWNRLAGELGLETKRTDSDG